MGVVCASGIICSCHPHAETGRSSIRVASWNVLSPRQQDWPTRRPAILERIEEVEADIVSLQEALARDLSDSIDHDMEALGYLSCHTDPDVDGIEPPVIYVRRSMFHVVWQDCHSRTISLELALRRGCCGFRKGQRLCLLNVHLAGAPGEGKTRISQTRKALLRAAQLAHNDDGQKGPVAAGVPFMIMGDFNESQEEGSLYKLLTTGSAAAADVPGNMDWWHPWGCFVDAHASCLSADELPSTWPCPTPRRRIDFLLATPGIECVDAHVAPLRCESKDYPSDHLLIAADFEISGLAKSVHGETDESESN